MLQAGTAKCGDESGNLARGTISGMCNLVVRMGIDLWSPCRLEALCCRHLTSQRYLSALQQQGRMPSASPVLIMNTECGHKT